MALPEFTLRQLLEAGVHFGHQTHRWNPRMGPYIYGDRNGIHIIDLTQTVPLLDQALHAVQQTVAKGGRILFVGTKRQASDPIATAAKRCAQYYVNHRWLGGTLTNWRTVSGSIARLRELEGLLEGESGRTKKELLQRAAQQRHGLAEVEDVDVVADAEDEALHLRVPAVGLVAKVSAGLEQAAHGEVGESHEVLSFRPMASADEKPDRCPTSEREGVGMSPPHSPMSACGMAREIGG